MTGSITGIIPVMITPFTADNHIDWASLRTFNQLVYRQRRRGPVCSLSVVGNVLSLAGRASGAGTFHGQNRTEPGPGRRFRPHFRTTWPSSARNWLPWLTAGVDGLILVTNRLAAPDGDSQQLRTHLDRLLAALPKDLRLGLYECPAPYRRLLTDQELEYCAQTGRFVLLKDVSCDLSIVKRRIALTKGTPLTINNANAAIAWPALQAGAAGFCGVNEQYSPRSLSLAAGSWFPASQPG